VLHAMRRELHYQARSARLALGFLTGRFIHCNLQVTYRCNFRCQICDFWKEDHDPADELSLGHIRLIGRKLNRLGTLIISLAGGEPLIREDLYDVITILNAAGHFPILITNGWFVDETVARDILRAGLQEISVSIDYRDPAKHDAQRGQQGAWDHAVRALELLHKNRPDRRNRVHMISVLMDDNLDEIEALIRLSRELGVTYMLNLYSWNRGTKAPRMPGSKGLTLTGQLGDVMKESAQAALSYTRAHAVELGLDADFFKNTDVHIHVPAGAIPKDGPSAGVTMAIALASLCSGRKVKHNVAMTGEITLRGKVLPVGSIRDKVLAAHRGGIKKVVIPEDNERDLADVPAEIRESLDIVLVEHVDDVLNAALHPERQEEPSKLAVVATGGAGPKRASRKQR